MHQVFLKVTCMLGWINILLFPVSTAFIVWAKLLNELTHTKMLPSANHSAKSFGTILWFATILVNFIESDKSWLSSYEFPVSQQWHRQKMTDPVPLSGGKAEPSSYLFLWQQNGSSIMHTYDQQCCLTWMCHTENIHFGAPGTVALEQSIQTMRTVSSHSAVSS